jgi:uncharacterized membrane protein YhaH (DUF805 family)
MGITTAIATCFRKYWVFKGRASRSEFWWFMLFGILAGFAADKLDRLVFGIDAENHRLVGIGTVEAFIVGPAAISASCRRLHDIGKSGWWQSLFLLAPPVLELGKFFKRSGADEMSKAMLVVVLVLIALPIYWWSRPSSEAGVRYQ